MKLSLALFASAAVAAKNDGDRLITNQANWADDIQAPEWWDNHPAWKRNKWLVNSVNDFFVAFNDEVSWKGLPNYQKILENTLEQAKKLHYSNDCTGSPNKNRRRRDADEDSEDEDFIQEDDGFARKRKYDKGLQKESHKFIWNMARWVKLEVYDQDTGNGKCAKQAERLLKRLDRMYVFLQYNMCKDGADFSYCQKEGGVYLDKKGNVKEDHPRNRKWFQEQSPFGWNN